MLKWIGLTALVSAAVLTILGCVRGLDAPAAAFEAETYTVKPVKAGSISSEVTVLWRDIGVYRASGPLRLAGPIYEVTSYETKAECEVAQQAAMAKEAIARVGPTTERLSDGIKTWDSDREHYTTFRYLCRLADAATAPLR